MKQNAKVKCYFIQKLLLGGPDTHTHTRLIAISVLEKGPTEITEMGVLWTGHPS